MFDLPNEFHVRLVVASTGGLFLVGGTRDVPSDLVYGDGVAGSGPLFPAPVNSRISATDAIATSRNNLQPYSKHHSHSTGSGAKQYRKNYLHHAE